MRKAGRGVTLVELLLSISLLSAIGYIIISLFPTSLLSLKRSHDSVAAGHIAQRYLEQMRTCTFDALTPRTVTTEQVGATVFTVERESQLETDTNVKYLRVTCTWDSGVAGGLQPVPASQTFETSVFRFSNP